MIKFIVIECNKITFISKYNVDVVERFCQRKYTQGFVDSTQIPFNVCIYCKRIICVAKIELLNVQSKIAISIVYISINLF